MQWDDVSHWTEGYVARGNRVITRVHKSLPVDASELWVPMLRSLRVQNVQFVGESISEARALWKLQQPGADARTPCTCRTV